MIDPDEEITELSSVKSNISLKYFGLDEFDPLAEAHLWATSFPIGTPTGLSHPIPAGYPLAGDPQTTMTPPGRNSDASEVELGRLPEKLRRFFLSRGVRTEDEARDMAQETLLRVLQRVDRGELLESPEAFALGVAKNVFFEYCRRQVRSNAQDGISSVVELPGNENPLTDALVNSRRLIVRKALTLLPDKMRELLVRRFVEEVPSRTIAREEGISTDAVDMRVYRAKRELKKRMEETRQKRDYRPPEPEPPEGGEP
ncbi:RNA polymerase sigma factor [Acidobacteria bacterium ACD]|nr:MAG: RNA polymerase sigma factor [Acidobacteriota bacterium]MCE7957711.1 RNA polymerase sigma factor [Acidobacteria bacterium ACB2]MDL1949296.1 RNA polymerase sigma factor [Acidobacteria bacterium ACD]